MHLRGQPHSALVAKDSFEGPIETDVQGLKPCGAPSRDVQEDHTRVSLLGPCDELLADVDCIAVDDDDPKLGGDIQAHLGHLRLSVGSKAIDEAAE